jgi:hypothetical protein
VTDPFFHGHAWHVFHEEKQKVLLVDDTRETCTKLVLHDLWFVYAILLSFRFQNNHVWLQFCSQINKCCVVPRTYVWTIFKPLLKAIYTPTIVRCLLYSKELLFLFPGDKDVYTAHAHICCPFNVTLPASMLFALADMCGMLSWNKIPFSSVKCNATPLQRICITVTHVWFLLSVTSVI